jgi:protease-4
MKTFLKMLLASILGGLILLFIAFVFIVSLASLAEQETKIVENTVLKLDLNTIIKDRADNNPLSGFDPFSLQPEIALGLDQVIGGLKAAAEDDRITGVFINGGLPLTGHATVKEIHNALKAFKASGKFVIGYTEILTQKGLYISSATDSFFVNPKGIVEWNGLNASVTYYKEALSKIGLQPEVLRATNNRFKSAVEPYLLQEMSEANRAQLNSLLFSVWDTYLTDIGEAKSLSKETLNDLADSSPILSPTLAASSGLIGGTAYYDEVLDMLANRTGVDKTDDISFLSFQKYSEGKKVGGTTAINSNRIAVIIAQGEIRDGGGSEYIIGSERIAKAIRKARNNKKVKAIVLRINSPGGSALASEVIWREVALAREQKPVIASMGDVAASGGYYIAAFADTILAQPNTITGSIGAFGLFFTGEELMHDKLGLNIETVPTNKYADLGTFDRALTPSEKGMLISQVDRIYNTFKERVAEGRGMTVDEVDSIGQGRVWSGTEALELGLVDVLGGLDDAIKIAAEKAEISDDYSVRLYPEQEDPFVQLMQQLGGNVKTSLIENELGSYAKYFHLLKDIKNREGMQTRMEYDITIE